MRRAVVATCTAALILLSLGAVYTTSTADESPEARTAKAIHDSTPEVVDVAAFLRPGSSTSTGVQRAIDSASRGDTVLFPAGVVDLDRPIRFASNLTYAAAEKGTTLRSVARGGLLIEHSPRVPLANVTIRGLRFDNIRIRLTGADDLTGISNVTFSGCAFVNGSESRDWHDAYLTLTYTDSVTVDSCQFLRSRGHGGRGVIIDKAQLTVVKDSWFGTTPNLEPGAPNGYFRTAINITGHDVSTGVGTHDTVIDGNTWRRTPGAVMPPSCTVCQDHGLYAWGSDRLFIVGNRADGWEASSAGGSMKLRNQQDTFVIGNHLKSSGILTYVYASQIMPTHLNRVMIRDNVIDLEGSLETCGHYCGINFWRNFGTGDSAHEENVMIRDNTFTKGGSITVADAHGPAFCVVANNNALLDFLTRGVRTSKCENTVDWDEPLAGVHRGDFNGDGVGDFVQAVRDEESGWSWRAHMSSGQGFRTEDWGRVGYTSELTSAFGVQVGDFDGDELDDLSYFGYCGDRSPCWRTYLSTGRGFASAADWGNGVYASSETLSHGVHVGDFDGDGKDDLVFRGNCGPAEACWRLLISTGDDFAAHNGGDAVRWDAADSADFGILVGDYNGDGRDDVAYRGLCDPQAASCFRVHVSAGTRFLAQDWGRGGFAPSGTTAHFGMRVGDLNDDGRSDLGFIGRCGEARSVGWRYHVSTGDSFVVKCSTDYEF